MKKALATLVLATLLLFAVSTLAADKVVVVPLGKSSFIVCGDVGSYCTPVADNKCYFNQDACCMGKYGKTCAATTNDCKAFCTGEWACWAIGYCDAQENACKSISNKLSN